MCPRGQLMTTPKAVHWGLRRKKSENQAQSQNRGLPFVSSEGDVGGFLSRPTSVGWIGDSGGKKTVNSGLGALDFELGWMAKQTKQKDAVPTALASEGWPGLYTEAAPGAPVTEPTAGMPRGGEERDV